MHSFFMNSVLIIIYCFNFNLLMKYINFIFLLLRFLFFIIILLFFCIKLCFICFSYQASTVLIKTR